MKTFTVTYAINYHIDFAPQYVFSGKQCYNLKTGRFVKQTLVGGSIGYCICGKFYSLKHLRNHLTKKPVFKT